GDRDRGKLVERAGARDAVERETGRWRVAAGPAAVEPDPGGRTGAQVAVPGQARPGHRGARLGPRGAPTVRLHLLASGEAEPQGPRRQRVTEVPHRDVGAEPALTGAGGPVVRRVGDLAAGGGVRRRCP